MRRWLLGRWRSVCAGVAIAALGVGVPAGCPGPQNADSGDGSSKQESVELPPMSEGTLQAMGPHVFVAETRVVPGEGSDRKARTERIELRWQDRQHYHLWRSVDGQPRGEEIREEDWVLVRKGEAPFLPGAAIPGLEVLRDTMLPGDRLLGEMEAVTHLTEDPREGDAGPRTFRLALLDELAVQDQSARDELQRRYAESGATVFPVSLEGEITTDDGGNRTHMRVTYGYRVAQGLVYGTPVIEKIHEESRELAPGGVDLSIPAEAAVWLAEARAQRAEATSGALDRTAR